MINPKLKLDAEERCSTLIQRKKSASFSVNQRPFRLKSSTHLESLNSGRVMFCLSRGCLPQDSRRVESSCKGVTRAK